MGKRFKVQNLLRQTRSNSGYNLLEMLVSLLICCLLISIAIPPLKALGKLMEKEKYRYQDEIGIYQLQVELAVNKIIEIDYEMITYQSSQSECYIEFVNRNLISTPGFLCFLYDVDYIQFNQDDEIIYLEYGRDGDNYEFPIAYKEKQ